MQGWDPFGVGMVWDAVSGGVACDRRHTLNHRLIAVNPSGSFSTPP
jgi:hypothetical protein